MVASVSAATGSQTLDKATPVPQYVLYAHQSVRNMNRLGSAPPALRITAAGHRFNGASMSQPVAPPAEPSTATHDKDRARRRAMISSYLGTTVEYYDFLLYGTAASLVFPTLFFHELSPTAATIASFATLAVGYLARPIGGVIFGHFGDKFGRKN